MKICLVNSSYEGANSPFEEYDAMPDPSRYIDKSRHEIVKKFVTKDNAKEEIDEICKDKFDFFMNYMWGTELDNVAGVEATRYLESKGVPMICHPSDFLSKSKLDLHKAVKLHGLLMPRDTPGRYPKIVKYSEGCGSLRLDYDSVCADENAVKKRIAYLQGIDDTPLMVSDYIIGTECSAIVLETGTDVVSLAPMKHVFPDGTLAEQAFLTWHNKFEECHSATIAYVFVEGEHKARLQKAAVDAFKALDVKGATWARVDMRLEQGTNNVYVLEINPSPVVFHPKDSSLGEDLVVTETFPGAQPALFDMMLATKMIQLGQHKEKNKYMAGIYDMFAPEYDQAWQQTGICKFQESMAADYDFSGTVLDLACGTGAFGRILHRAGVKAEVTGIEVSEAMVKASPEVNKCYKQPIIIGSMEEEIMRAGEYDHIVCFGAMHFLPSVMFNAVLAKMFMLARKSVSIDTNEFSEEYLKGVRTNYGPLFLNIDHADSLGQFGVPKGWKLVRKSRDFMYDSPHFGCEVYGYSVHFERE